MLLKFRFNVLAKPLRGKKDYQEDILGPHFRKSIPLPKVKFYLHDFIKLNSRPTYIRQKHLPIAGF
jgi:hypothetical protein